MRFLSYRSFAGIWIATLLATASSNAEDSSAPKPILWLSGNSLLEDSAHAKNLATPGQVLEVQGNVDVAPGDETRRMIRFDGTSGAIDVGPSGVSDLGTGKTIIARLQFDEVGSDPESAAGRDMILWSPGHFIFGRLANAIYTNVRDADDWVAPLISPPLLQQGVPIAVAVVFEPVDIPAEGRKGWLVKQFLNGALIAEKEFPITSLSPAGAAAFVGRGSGDSWFFGGSIEDLKVFDLPLSSEQIQALSRPKLPQIAAPAMSGELAAALGDVERAIDESPGTPASRTLAWVAGTIRDHFVDLDQSKAAKTLRSLSAFCLKDNPDQNAIIRHANTISTQLRFFLPDDSDLGLCWKTDLTAKKDAILSLYDFARDRELLDGIQIPWILALAGNETIMQVAADDPNVTCRIEPPDTNSDTPKSPLQIEWRYSAPDGLAEIQMTSHVVLEDSRLSMNLSLKNRSQKWTVTEATFPIWQLRALDGKDELAVPKWSGVSLVNPVDGMKSYEGIYPSARASMQFGAYSNGNAGIYFASEDTEAQSKALIFQGVDGGISAGFRWFVGQLPDGGNDFQVGSINVLESFSGGWFDAAEIYREFAETAPWWPADPLRPETPEAFKQVILWLRESEDIDNAVAFTKYLGVPVGYHWYNWHAEPFDTYYPQFTPRPDFKERLAKLHGAEILVKLYLNALLWARKGPDDNLTFGDAALPSAVRLQDGTVPEQIYPPSPNGNRFMIMCPAATFWQQKLVANSLSLAALGANAIYYDQLAAAKPIQCFSEDHGHAPGAGSSWAAGYRQILKSSIEQIRKENPNFAFDSEDASEPYVNLLDGFLPWRHVDDGQIPMFNAVYGGRTQFTGRIMSGDEGEALYAKIATQTVNNEQLGWMAARQFNNPMFADFALFVKKMAHLRQTLLPIFNGGTMGRPIQFSEPPPPVTTQWKAFGWSPVTLPAIQSAVWQRDGVAAAIFINTTDAKQSATVRIAPADYALDGENLAIVRFSEANPEGILSTLPAVLQETIDLPPRQAAVWLMAPPGHPDLETLVSGTKRLFSESRQFVLNIPKWPDSAIKSPANWLGTGDAESYFGCLLLNSKSDDTQNAPVFRNITRKSLIDFGMVDFGAAGAALSAIEVRILSKPDLKEGTLEVRIGDPFNGPIIAQSPILPGNAEFEVLKIPMKKIPESADRVFFVLDRTEGDFEFSAWRTSDQQAN